MRQSLAYSTLILFTLLFPKHVVHAQAAAPVKADTSAGALVVAAHPLAVSTGMDILKKGGNAVDAAVAMAFVVGVAEPHASGLGGGGGMLIFQKQTNELHYLDYYVRAPGIVDTTFTGRDGVATPLAVCVPGTPAGLVRAAEKFGKLDLPVVMAPALTLARTGIKVNQGLYDAMLEKLELIMTFPETEQIYFKEGLPAALGDTIFNPGLVHVLEGIQNSGDSFFYSGQFAQNAAEKIRAMGGWIRVEDFQYYKALLKEPVSTSYKGFKIYSSAPPQSGITLLEILKIIEHAPPNLWHNFLHNARSAHLLIEAIKLADIDRFFYLGDPAFVEVPTSGLLNPEYTRHRYAQILPRERIAENNRLLKPGEPFKFQKPESESQDLNEGHTTHISVVDFEGNAVSLTQTLGLFFGSGVSVDGILFNSSMSIFYDAPVANKMEPFKRPASTICPTMILKDSSLVGVLGTPGGGNIFNTMAQVILYLLDFNLSPSEAMDAPRFSTRISREHINFESRFNKEVLDSLKEMGHTIRLSQNYNVYMGGVQLIFWDDSLKKYIGVSDIRRDGAALGSEVLKDQR